MPKIAPHNDIEILYDADTLAARVRQMGEQISKDYRGEELTVVGILKGSFVFMADVVRHIDVPLSCEFMGISSYGDDTKSSGVVQITSDLSETIHDKNVLVVEDIVDTGLTIRYLLDNFATRKPRSVKICTLLHKPDNTQTTLPLDYVGFRIPNHFVVGYGLDLASHYRNLPYIGIYHGDASQG